MSTSTHIASRWAQSARRSLGPLALLLASGCSGKGVEGICPDLPACGGDPTGSWQVQSQCEFKVPTPPLATNPIAPGYTTPQSPGLSTAPPAATSTSGDWCSGLVYFPPGPTGVGGLQSIQLWAPPWDYEGNGSVIFDAARQTITTNSNYGLDYVTHFTPGCIQAYGAHPACKDISDGVTNGGFVNYRNVNCYDASDGGCDCSYNIGEASGETGRYEVVGSSIYIFDNPGGKPPHALDFCVGDNGNSLTLSGKNGTQILGNPGRRSMVLTKVTAP